MIAVVGEEGRRGGLEFVAAGGGVHDLVANQDAGGGREGGAEGGKEFDAVAVGPHVAGRRKPSTSLIDLGAAKSFKRIEGRT